MRSFGSSVARQPKSLLLPSSNGVGMTNLAKDDVLFNWVTEEDCLKKTDGKPWRGPKEKSFALLQSLISGTCPLNGTIVDLTAGTGLSFYLVYLLFKLHDCLAVDHFNALINM